ncbi:hypothetical protein AX16_002395 [Volvariella volvacea WC 439]|nr:hypothetical protein AX16_002395 [Volvariella volvacea WC 439]
MATNYARLPQRRSATQRVKADENATSRHIRQSSGITGVSRYSAKDNVGAAKPSYPRQALGEVTMAAVNRKENTVKTLPGKDKEEVGSKRGRSNSSSTAPQRVPLRPTKTQVTVPAPSANNARVPAVRTRVSAITNPKVTSRPAPQPVVVVHEQNDYHAEDAHHDMDIEDEAAIDTPSEEEVEANISVGEQEVETLIEPHESEDEVEPVAQLPEPGVVRVWPDVSPERAKQYEREVRRIQETFEEVVNVQDTTMVSEYADEIFEYMCELEEDMMPNPEYMDNQNEITWPLRQRLVDWLLQVHLRYHMFPETLWIAVNIVDRFLSKRVVSLAKLQLVGVTAMFIAAKYEEILAPSVEEFVFMTDNGFSKEEILKGERIVLQTLDFRVSQYCSPYSWMRKISRADDYDLHTRTLSKFLTEVTLLDHNFLRVKPSLVAAVGMYCARKMLGGDWDDAFVFYSGYTEEQLRPGHELLIAKLLEPGFEKQYIFKKYAHRKFMQAAIYATQWAQDHTEEVLGYK